MSSDGEGIEAAAQEAGSRWVVHGERSLYESEWMSLRIVDVTLTDGTRLDHHVVRVPRPAVATVVVDPDRGVLLLWRHRFITDTWGWEAPAGRVDEGESLAEAAARECAEESGWRPNALRQLAAYHPTNGISDQTFVVFVADGATYEGPPTDPNEAARVEWVSVEEVRRLVLAGAVTDGLSLTALLRVLAELPPS